MSPAAAETEPGVLPGAREGPPVRAGLIRNMTWLALGNLAVKPIWFLFTTFVCMRALGPAAYGVFVAASALALIVAAFSDWGLSDYTVREVTQARTQTPLFSSLFALRTGLAVLGLTVTVALGWAMGQRGPTLVALAAAGVYFGALRLLEYTRAYYRAFEVLRYESVSIVTERLAAVVGGTVALAWHATPASLLLGMSVGTGAALIGNVGWVHRRLVALAPRHIQGHAIGRALVGAFPLGVYGALSILFLNVGTVLLERLGGAQATGQFGAAYRFVEISTLLPTVVVAAVYPRLAALHGQGEVAFWPTLWKAAGLSGLAACVVAVVTMGAGPTLLRLLADDAAFTSDGRILDVLAWQIPLMTVSSVLGAGLMALGEMRTLVTGLLVIVPLTVGLNIALVPVAGAVGTGAALVVGQAVATAFFLARIVRVRRATGTPSPLGS